jgi:hypothetical protein
MKGNSSSIRFGSMRVQNKGSKSYTGKETDFTFNLLEIKVNL